ncbi:MAG: NAD(P)-binding domain-containing protein [Actinomadura sp.]
MMSAGVVGLGAMGGPIALHLVRAGIPVRCFDLDPDVTAGHAAEAVATAGEVAARSSAVFVFVPTDDDVVSVCTAELLPAARPGTVVAICSSVRPDTCAAVAAVAPDGVAVLDTALTGGVRGAEQGGSTCSSAATRRRSTASARCSPRGPPASTISARSAPARSPRR